MTYLPIVRLETADTDTYGANHTLKQCFICEEYECDVMVAGKPLHKGDCLVDFLFYLQDMETTDLGELAADAMEQLNCHREELTQEQIEELEAILKRSYEQDQDPMEDGPRRYEGYNETDIRECPHGFPSHISCPQGCN